MLILSTFLDKKGAKQEKKEAKQKKGYGGIEPQISDLQSKCKPFTHIPRI